MIMGFLSVDFLQANNVKVQLVELWLQRIAAYLKSFRMLSGRGKIFEVKGRYVNLEHRVMSFFVDQNTAIRSHPFLSF